MTTSSRSWTGASLRDSAAWLYSVDSASFSERSAEILDELRNGRGFVILRGLTLNEFLEGCGGLGSIIPQTNSGDRLYSVRDEGIRIERDYGKPGVRTSKTNAAFDFHTDSPSRLAGHTPEFIALYAEQTAKEGGESALVNAYAVEAALRKERPELLARLYQPYWMDRRAEVPAGGDPVVPVPVFSTTEPEGLKVRYLRLYINKGHEQRQIPLQGVDVAALDFLDSVMNRPEMALTVPMERGDVQIVNNRFVLHSRTAFVDHPEPNRKRHYIRIWLNDL
jgi:alpha-ketoglutarate-dependent taurine dioxygenase